MLLYSKYSIIILTDFCAHLFTQVFMFQVIGQNLALVLVHRGTSNPGISSA